MLKLTFTRGWHIGLDGSSIDGGGHHQARVSSAGQDGSDADPDVSVDEDVEYGIDQAVEIGEGHNVPEEGEVANHEYDGIGPPAYEKSWEGRE